MINLIFSFNPKSGLLLLFFIHGLVYGFLLVKQGVQSGNKANFWIAVFLLLCAFYICPFMLGYAGWYSRQPYRDILFYLPLQQVFLLGPVIYFFVRSLLDNGFHLKGRDLLHFLPAIIYALYSMVVFITDQVILNEYYFYADQRDKDLTFWYQAMGLVSMVIYLFISLKVYRQYRKNTLNELSYANEVSYQWVRNFIWVLGSMLILRVLLFLLNPEWGEFGSKFWYYLAFSILTFYAAISAYTSSVRSVLIPPIALQTEPVKEKAGKSGSVNENSDNTFSPDLIQRLEELFETEAVHENDQLTLTQLAETLQTNRSILSQLINQHYQMNFNDFINAKRIVSVIVKLKRGEHKRLSLLGIALSSGFNSKTTFNRAFKKHTGVNPQKFIEKEQL